MHFYLFIRQLPFYIPISSLTLGALPYLSLPGDPFVAALEAFQGLEMELHGLEPHPHFSPILSPTF